MINISGKQLEINVLLDTGNMLKDPISGDSVIMIEKNKLNSIFPEKILNNIDKILGGDLESAESLEYRKRLRFIPFTSVGKQNGMLIGIKPEYLKIIKEEQINVKENVILGIYDKSLTKKGEYRALMGMEFV